MSDDPLLVARDLRKHYPVRSGLLRRVTGQVRAVDGVDLEVRRGEALGLVGESGCGKSTTARTLLHLEEPTDGTVRFDGERVGAFDSGERKRFRRRAQLLFQDPESSFDPRMTVGQSLAEPMEIHGLTDPDRQAEIIDDLLERVGLEPDAADRYPHEFSGGQKQRLALARALVFDPDLLVADEPVSGLDERVQSAILSLLADLQSARDLSILFVSHDVRTVRRFCDRIAVMYLGEVVERGPVEAVLDDPQHPYTRALVDAVPSLDPAERGGLRTLAGDVPDPADPPAGCRFHTRCPAVVPPDEYDLDGDAYRGIVRLRVRVGDGDLDPATARREAAGSGEDSTTVDDERVRASLREAHGVPAELTDESAEAELSAALSAFLDGDVADAHERLSSSFESVCERRAPETHETATGAAACHRHDPEVAAGSTWTE
jgi:peptide/nickel transport system ATP-binding protein